MAPTGPLMAPGLGVDVATGVPGALEVGDVMTERGVCGELVGVVAELGRRIRLKRDFMVHVGEKFSPNQRGDFCTKRCGRRGTIYVLCMCVSTLHVCVNVACERAICVVSVCFEVLPIVPSP